MQRISLAWFAQTGVALQALGVWEDEGPAVTVVDLFQARNFLNVLVDEKAYPLDLRASRPLIREMLLHVNAVLENSDPQRQQEKLEETKYQIWNISGRLDTLLNGELAVQPVYYVWPKRAYNTEILVTTGENIFSEEVRREFTEQERYDAQQAGKCLAFETATAAAFHIFRCAESLLRRYYEVVVGQLPKPKMRNWGAYITNLRKCGADERVLAILEHIKDVHRNPVIHPESQMGNEEALSLVGIIESVMNAMAMDMKKRRENPTLPFPAGALASQARPS